MDILYLSHCVPNPPDKGEKIRAFHQVMHLAKQHRVHLACFARTASEIAAAQALAGSCASVHAERLRTAPALALAGLRFATGACLTTSFYRSSRLRCYIQELVARVPMAVTVAYSSAMAPYAPAGVPLLLDLVDVDSEKWYEYARLRSPRRVFALEAERLRKLERTFAARAHCTLLATRQEEKLFHSIAPAAVTSPLENGVDLAYFDPARCPPLAEWRHRRFLVFVGAMDYFPNRDAVCWFVNRILPGLRGRYPDLEFFIVGRNPTPDVRRLARRPGVTVTGGVEDVRPYLAAARAFVAPLRIARGIQNKVLEALAMGKTVLASSAVAKTFGPELPAGVILCESEAAFVAAAAGLPGESSWIRREAGRRFSWATNLEQLSEELERCADAHREARQTTCEIDDCCSSATYSRQPGALPSSVR
jgi:sugar transferase (PEP-CTERM/EpsH1 system associated)